MLVVFENDPVLATSKNTDKLFCTEETPEDDVIHLGSSKGFGLVPPFKKTSILKRTATAYARYKYQTTRRWSFKTCSQNEVPGILF